MTAQRTQHAPDGATGGTRRPTRRADGEAAHSLRIGRLFGIPLQVHWSFLLLIALVVVAEWPGGAAPIAGGLIFVAALFACVVAHELAHCLLARRRGGTVLGILLLPIGGMSRMDQIPSSPSDEAAIAAIGPVTSLVLGGLFLSVGALLGSSMWPPTLIAGSWWARLGWVNLLLGVFNLLPALPMDGGRVLRATLARRLPRLAATRVAANVARALAIGLIVFGVFYDFWLVFIGIFVLLGASREESVAKAEELARRQPPGSAWWGRFNHPPQSPPPPPPGFGPGGWYPPPPGYGQGDWGPSEQQVRWYPPSDWRNDPSGQSGWYPPPSPDPRQSWPPPFGQDPAPARRSAVDVAVERRGPDAVGGETFGEGVGEHD